jgi:hypothetical protein
MAPTFGEGIIKAINSATSTTGISFFFMVSLLIHFETMVNNFNKCTNKWMKEIGEKLLIYFSCKSIQLSNWLVKTFFGEKA